MSERVVEIEDLTVAFPTEGGLVEALRGVSLHADRGEIVGLVGESGSGKSVTGMTLMRLIQPSARTTGTVRVLGREVLALPDRELRKLRGREVAYIFQEPMTALNPTRRIGDQLTDVIREHLPVDKAEARERARALLADMRLPDPTRTLRAYPFELSGGMRQRVVIAMAFSCLPKVIVADEPTTALDVTVQAQVLALLVAKARETGTTVILISHDLAVVAHLAARIYVMRRGRIVEEGPATQVIGQPKHPYTRGLLAALPERNPPKTPLPTMPEASDG